MPRVGFELTIPVFDPHALDGAATVIGSVKFDCMEVENVYLLNPRSVVKETDASLSVSDVIIRRALMRSVPFKMQPKQQSDSSVQK
jgi:hypothetical protein